MVTQGMLTERAWLVKLLSIQEVELTATQGACHLGRVGGACVALPTSVDPM